MTYVNVQGEEVPAIGYGTWGLRGDECTRAVADALAIGYRHLDTAEGYDNEEAVGRGIAESSVPRDDIFLTTKVWIGGESRDDVLRRGIGCLKRLRVDYVDLLLIHWPTHDMDLPGALDAMMQLHESGRVRHIGVSNFTPRLLEEALGLAPIFCNQVEYHPYLDQSELLGCARKYDMLFAAYSPVAKGKVAHDPVLAEMGRRHGKSATQIAIRWLIQQEHVATIPKAASAEHRRSNIDVFDFELGPDEMDAIFALARNERIVDPEWAPWA
ncbi:MAG TPA: aldo/keto reductase [Rhodothermales bacterium]